MTDTLARMRQLIGSTADWAANDLVIGDGEIAVERKAGGVIGLRVGNGTDRFSQLSEISGAATSVTWASITGKPATFPAAPSTWASITGKPATFPADPATWASITGKPATFPADPASAALTAKLSLTGGTMTGQIVLPGGGTGKDAATVDQVNGLLPAAAAGVLANDGTGALSWTATEPVGGGAPMAGRLPVLDANGLLPWSMLPPTIAGGMHFKGIWTPTAGAEYPPTPNEGDMWLDNGADYQFTAGDLAGMTASTGDAYVYDGTAWHLILTGTGGAGATTGMTQAAADARYLQKAGGTMAADAKVVWPTAGATAGTVIIDGGAAANAHIDNVTLDMGTF